MEASIHQDDHTEQGQADRQGHDIWPTIWGVALGAFAPRWEPCCTTYSECMLVQRRLAARHGPQGGHKRHMLFLLQELQVQIRALGTRQHPSFRRAPGFPGTQLGL